MSSRHGLPAIGRAGGDIIIIISCRRAQVISIVVIMSVSPPMLVPCMPSGRALCGYLAMQRGNFDSVDC